MSYNQPRYQHQLSRHVVKTTTAATVGGSLMVLYGLTLTATVVGLVLATPLIVIFSPVLVPAVITAFLIAAGFLTSGGLGAAAALVFYWMYKYATGKHPVGVDQLDRVRQRIACAATELKDRIEQYFGQQHHLTITGAQQDTA